MATDPRPLISDDLLHQVEETAREQNRQPEEVVSEAVRKYLDEQSWVRFVERNEIKAKAMGITEEDIPRLVDEMRRENETRGR
jgi:predicted transcriptional regulator